MRLHPQLWCLLLSLLQIYHLIPRRQLDPSRLKSSNCGNARAWLPTHPPSSWLRIQQGKGGGERILAKLSFPKLHQQKREKGGITWLVGGYSEAAASSSTRRESTTVTKQNASSLLFLLSSSLFLIAAAARGKKNTLSDQPTSQRTSS